MPRNINKLGERVDGWADIVLGAGEEAELARRQLEVIIQRKSFPGTLISTEMITPSFGGGNSRNFILAEMDNGATVAAYIGSFGRDLYAKWDIYVKKFLNTTVIGVVLGVSTLIGLIFGSILGSFVSSFGGSGFAAFLAGLILGTSLTFIPAAMIILTAGYVVKQNPLGFILKDMDEFQFDDMGALMLAVDKAMRDTLDAIGIETKALRMKEHFSVGRRERII